VRSVKDAKIRKKLKRIAPSFSEEDCRLVRELDSKSVMNDGLDILIHS